MIESSMGFQLADSYTGRFNPDAPSLAIPQNVHGDDDGR